MSWSGEKQRHSCSARGIRTTRQLKAKGFAEIVDPKDVPFHLFHATTTKNVKNILDKGFELGKEESRSLEYEWDEFRPVESKIFFTETLESSSFFGMQAVESKFKRAGKKISKEDIDYTILKINSAEFEEANIHLFKGAELFGTGEKEYFIKYKIPRFWIEGGIRVYWSKNKNTIIREGFRVKWKGADYKVIPIKEEWV